MSAALDSSVFCFADDVLSPGADGFCRELAEAGFGGVTVATTYHAARDLRPRAGRVSEAPPGARYFPDATFDPADSLVPTPFDGVDLLAELREATARENMSLTAWTIFCHDGHAGARRPELCQQNILGDRLSTDLCPANPAVRDRVLALAGTVLRRRPDRLLAESLHFHPFREWRRFLPLDAESRLALGLCCCEHCRAAASRAGVDAQEVADWARGTLGRAFAGRAIESAARLSLEELGTLAGGAIAGYLAARCAVVTALVAEVAERARQAGSTLVTMDQAGTETPVLGTTKVEEALRYGVDVAALGAVVDGYQVLAYGADPEQAAADVAGYRAALPERVAVRAALRPSWPDSTSEENLSEKLEAVRAAGAAGVDFYHYGLASTDAFERASLVMERMR